MNWPPSFAPPVFRALQFNRGVGRFAFPSVEGFVSSYVSGSPLAGPVLQANDAARDALVTDVKNALGKYTSNTELAFRVAAHLVTARV